jgi:hypothetical protein
VLVHKRRKGHEVPRGVGRGMSLSDSSLATST